MKVEKNIKPPKKALRKTDVMAMLLSDDDAGVIAVNIASNVEPKLTTQEESFFFSLTQMINRCTPLVLAVRPCFCIAYVIGCF